MRLRVSVGVAAATAVVCAAAAFGGAGGGTTTTSAGTLQASQPRTYQLRWPLAPGQTVTRNIRFRSPHVRAISLQVYGKTVPRGFGFDFIVACEHRGPAILNWDWAQSDGYVRITIRMTTGSCEPPGQAVAGAAAAVTVRGSSGGSSTSSAVALSAGRWTGSVKQSNLGSPLRLTLKLPSAPRSQPGRVEIPAAGCAGTLRYVRTDVSRRSVFAVTWQRGPCANGTIWLRVVGKSALSYRWEDGRGTFAVATLRRGGASSGKGSGSSAAGLRTFVDGVESVLRQSAAGRRDLSTLLAAGFSCSITPSEAARRVARVADNRRSILGRLGSLQVRDGQTREALGLLRAAVQHSITADIHYRDGFASIANARCPLTPNSSFALARRSDALATAAKQRFVTAFNRLARSVNRRTWSSREI